MNEDNAFTCCASRFGLGGRPDCKWTTGGLFRIGGVCVIRPDFVPVLAFAFADTEPLKDRIRTGDAVRVYRHVNRPEQRIGEVRAAGPDGSFQVTFATIDIQTGETTVETLSVPPEALAVDRDANERLRHGGGIHVMR